MIHHLRRHQYHFRRFGQRFQMSAVAKLKLIFALEYVRWHCCRYHRRQYCCYRLVLHLRHCHRCTQLNLIEFVRWQLCVARMANCLSQISRMVMLYRMMLNTRCYTWHTHREDERVRDDTILQKIRLRFEMIVRRIGDKNGVMARCAFKYSKKLCLLKKKEAEAHMQTPVYSRCFEFMNCMISKQSKVQACHAFSSSHSFFFLFDLAGSLAFFLTLAFAVRPMLQWAYHLHCTRLCQHLCLQSKWYCYSIAIDWWWMW